MLKRAAPAKNPVERARIEQLENQLRRLLAQRERTQVELEAIAPGDIEARIEELSMQAGKRLKMHANQC